MSARPKVSQFVTEQVSPIASKFKVFTNRHLDSIAQFQDLPETVRFGIRVAAAVFPFRVNQYVIDELIDWSNWESDPIFRLAFPQKEMLTDAHFGALAGALESSDREALKAIVDEVRATLNPHPAGQMELNVPTLDGEVIEGIQHKYRETVLFFPKQGQTCHTYCTFCFRWAQFIGDTDLQFAAREVETLINYLRQHKEVSDVLITGGDPLVMKTRNLAAYIDTILNTPGLEHIRTIRIGTKALSFWPHRFVTDNDADDLLKLFERVVASGRHLALMAHYNHWKELDTGIARQAIARVRETGANIRSQGPLLKGINDTAEVWAKLWRMQVNLGITPYYMFIERDTGARHYFEVPLLKAWHIYRGAMQKVSGLCRTARGPSMSAEPGKVELQGVTEIRGEKVLTLRFIQGRDPDWVQRPFFAKYDEQATWLDDLEPAFGGGRFFFL